MPSAIVEAGGSVTRSRASSARFIAGSVSACTPITRTSGRWDLIARPTPPDRKSTRLNSSHGYISYAVFCLKKKKEGRGVSDRCLLVQGEGGASGRRSVAVGRLARLTG